MLDYQLKIFDKTFSLNMKFVNIMQFVIHANQEYTFDEVVAVVIFVLFMIQLLVASEKSEIIPFC